MRRRQIGIKSLAFSATLFASINNAQAQDFPRETSTHETGLQARHERRNVQDVPKERITTSRNSVSRVSPALSGTIGLNTVPTARMDPPGTLRAGISTLDPFLNSFIGIQIAEPLSLTIRQTAEISSLNGDAKHLYPGIDFKLKLIDETAYRPQIALGVQSALGHKRMAGEYIALSKRYKALDFTGGLGWGRFGTARHFQNPLSGLSNHFDKTRDYTSEAPNEPSSWFTGKDVGLFGGIELFLPYDGVSLKFDYGADRYSAEKATFDYHSAAPWSAGLAYTYNNWLSAGIAAQGTDKVMGRLSIQSTPAQWPLSPNRYSDTPRPLYKEHPQRTNTARMLYEAAQDGITLSDIWIAPNKTQLFATLHLPENVPAPKHVGRATRHIIANADQDIEEITLTLQTKGLRGTRVSLMRSDIEHALNKSNKSANEIWQNATISDDKSPQQQEKQPNKEEETPSPFLPPKRLSISKNIADFLPFTKETQTPTPLKQSPSHPLRKAIDLRLILENKIGLSEENNGLLRRSSLIAETTSNPFAGFFIGSALRLNLSDNLDNISSLRPKALTPVHSDEDAFTDKTIGMDRSYISYMHSLTPELHSEITAGYLEESFAGIGGELLFRPIYSRFAIGAEGWQVFKRNPNTALNSGLNKDSKTTGHLHLWYDIPAYDITAKFSAGRYLWGDTGLTAGLEKHFENGAVLSASTTLSNAADADLFGSSTHNYHELKLSLPLGSLPYIRAGSTLRTKSAPFGRDSGQMLDKPLDLYTLTNSFGINNIARHWPEIIE